MYFVVETQVTKEGTGATLVTTHADRNNAESDYHRILSAAAVSNVYKHGAIVLSDDCYPIMYTAYEHGEDNENG